jgi:hypothetical protein
VARGYKPSLTPLFQARALHAAATNIIFAPVRKELLTKASVLPDLGSSLPLVQFKKEKKRQPHPKEPQPPAFTAAFSVFSEHIKEIEKRKRKEKKKEEMPRQGRRTIAAPTRSSAPSRPGAAAGPPARVAGPTPPQQRPASTLAHPPAAAGAPGTHAPQTSSSSSQGPGLFGQMASTAA